MTALICAMALTSVASASMAAEWQDRILGQVTSPDEDMRRAKFRRQQKRSKYLSTRRKRIAKRKPIRRRRITGRSMRIPVRRYYTNARKGDVLKGLASYYWQPQRTAAGGWFNPNALTAAHRALPLGTRVRVTNLRNGRSVIVRINDRGPYIRGRIIDLSRRAATIIRMRKAGVVPVHVKILN